MIDTDTLQYDVLDNPNIAASGGAGIQTAQLLASQDIQAVITGNCGPNAFMTLEAADIQVFVGASGSIQTVVEQYKQGQLQAASQANVAGHFGDQRGIGQGRGGGMGRGRR
jgi:predicted Fe-Mo cluster-binding NifX family protein